MKKNTRIILGVYALIEAITLMVFDGTGDAGDSIQHYIHSKFALTYPELFLNHWAKPVFVMLSFPFAQFGIPGIKLFNALVSWLAVYFACRVAAQMQLQRTWLVALICIFTPMFYVLTFSGLTEPLFALFTMVCIYLYGQNKLTLASLVASLLPFVRPEGYVMACVFALYLLHNKQWKIIPYLLAGHLLFTVAGGILHHDFLWLIHQTPYTPSGQKYGSGKLTHFMEQLYFAVGVPIFILLWVGVAAIGRKALLKQVSSQNLVLVWFGFMAFFGAHTMFRFLGLFNSMGLPRVLVGVVPLIAIIAVQGWEQLSQWLPAARRKILDTAIFIYLVIFPFTSHPAAIRWPEDMQLNTEQRMAKQVAAWLSANGKNDQRLVFAHPYLGEVTQIDYFNKSQRLKLREHNLPLVQKGDIVIWDSWYAVVEGNITRKKLNSDTSLYPLEVFTETDNKQTVTYVVFEKH